MISTVSVNPPDRVKSYTEVTISAEGSPLHGFPLLSIDRDSYVVSSEIHGGINFRVEEGCHHIAIGKETAIADGVVMMIDQDHDFNAVAQGGPSFLDGSAIRRTRQRGSIIIQNDVWVGSGVTIMPGVILHNGCIVAAKSVVTKDVPPYAVVGGNPARILRYRFEKKVVDAFQKIAWWDWNQETQRLRKDDFLLSAEEFTEKYLPEAEKNELANIVEKASKKVVLFPADLGSVFPLYPKVLAAYFEKDRPNTELLIYLPEERSHASSIYELERILKQYASCDSYVTLQTGITLDERILFQGADYYVTTRDRSTVYRTCLADRYGVKTLFGTDTFLFPAELQ